MNYRLNIVALAGALLVATGVLSSCTVARVTVDETTYDRPIRVACVGDSITYGSRIENRDTNSYPAQLGAMLGPKWDVRNFGVSGATLLDKGNKPYKQQAAYRDALAFKPDVVVIMLGTNDSKPVNWDMHKDEYVHDYNTLIDRFAALDPKPVIYLCRPMPAFPPGAYTIRPAVIAHEVVPKVTAIARARGLPVIDQFAALSCHGDMVPDHVHPNAQGARLLAKSVYLALHGMPVAP